MLDFPLVGFVVTHKSLLSSLTETFELLCFTDLYACKSNPLTTNSSVILDEITSVDEKGRGGFKRRMVHNTTVCSSHSSSNQYLEIQLKYFTMCARSPRGRTFQDLETQTSRLKFLIMDTSGTTTVRWEK